METKKGASEPEYSYLLTFCKIFLIIFIIVVVVVVVKEIISSKLGQLCY